MKTFLFFISLSFFGCSTVPITLSTASSYKKELFISSEGLEGNGTLVLPRRISYVIEIKSKGKMDLVTVTSCHRDLQFRDAGSGIFKKNSMSFIYTPDPTFEAGRVCALDIGVYEEGKGRHTWGWIDFEDERSQIPAKISCNGHTYHSNGVAVCDSRVGLGQGVEFASAMKVEVSAGCSITTENNLLFMFKAQAKECLFLFHNETSTSRVTSLGYTSVGENY